MDKKTYENMKEYCGKYGSWAIWTSEGRINDMSWVEDKDLLLKLNTGFVFVGLNVSHGGQTDWTNFHSGRNDYKLRYILKDSRYWGSYMTDLIKNFPEVDSSEVRRRLRDNPEIVKANIETLKKELSYLGKNLVIVALGKDTNCWLKENEGELKQNQLVRDIVRVTHYAYRRIRLNEYKTELEEALEKF